MARLDDWQTLLADELSKPRSFSWGKNDCCLFAGDIVQTITGIDPAATFRGKYDTALGAIKEIKRQGLNILGWRDVPVNSKVVGAIASQSQPNIKQVFIGN